MKIIILLLFYIMVSCVPRSADLSEQSMMFNNNFDLSNFKRYTQKDGSIVFFPKDYDEYVVEEHLRDFNVRDYYKAEYAESIVYIPKNKALVRQIQAQRHNNKFDPKTAPVIKTNAQKMDLIVVGEGLPEFESKERKEKLKKVRVIKRKPNVMLSH